MTGALDIEANRSARKWSHQEMVGRLLWALLQPLFSFSPRPLWAWRRLLLRMFGAKIGDNVHIYPSVRIQIPWNISIGDHSAVGDRAILYALGPITIGQQVTISQFSHLCAGSHDYRSPDMALTKPPIHVDDGAWICADAFIGPGVRIHPNAIVAARAVVIKNVEADAIVGGNPAAFIKKRELRST